MIDYVGVLSCYVWCFETTMVSCCLFALALLPTKVPKRHFYISRFEDDPAGRGNRCFGCCGQAIRERSERTKHSCLNNDKYDKYLDHDARKDFFSSSKDRIVWPPVSSSNEDPEGMVGTVEVWGGKEARCERCENASGMRSSDMGVLSRTDLERYYPV